MLTRFNDEIRNAVRGTTLNFSEAATEACKHFAYLKFEKKVCSATRISKWKTEKENERTFCNPKEEI